MVHSTTMRHINSRIYMGTILSILSEKGNAVSVINTPLIDPYWSLHSLYEIPAVIC
jgi:hypothetical protein